VAWDEAGLLAQVWRAAAPKWAGTGELEPRHAAGAGPAFVNSILMPITLGSRVISIVELLAVKARPYDPELLSSLRAVGSQVGQYMQRRRAEDDLRIEKEYIGHVLASAPTLIASIAP